MNSDNTRAQKHSNAGFEEQEQITELSHSTIDATGTDDLLDEIDDLLENNAEEFIRSYVQKGGE